MNPKHFYVRAIGGYMGFYLRVPFDPSAFAWDNVAAGFGHVIARWQTHGRLMECYLQPQVQHQIGASNAVCDLIKRILDADVNNVIELPTVLHYDHVLEAEILNTLGRPDVQVRVIDLQELFQATNVG